MSAPTPLLPAACARARDAIGIALIDEGPERSRSGERAIDGVSLDAVTQAHLATCADCARVAAAMRAAWDGAGRAIAALGAGTPPPRLESILEGAIRDGRRDAAVPVFLPLRARVARRPGVRRRSRARREPGGIRDPARSAGADD